MKKLSFIALFFVLAIFIIKPTTILANDNISVAIAGQPVHFSGQGPAIVDGRTLVPIRDVFEALGFTVEWEPESQEIILTGYDGWTVVVLTVGSGTFTAFLGSGSYGDTYALDVPAQIINGRTMIPIRLPLESVGFEMRWDGENRHVLVYNNTEMVRTPSVTAPVLTSHIPAINRDYSWLVFCKIKV